MKNNLYLRFFIGLIILTIFSTIILSFFIQPSESTPAAPIVYTHVQKDGTLVFLKGNGDEFFNFTTDSNGNLVDFGEDGDIYIAGWAKESDFWENERPLLVVPTSVKPKGAPSDAKQPEHDDMPQLLTPIPKYISEYVLKRRIWNMNQTLPMIATITLPSGIKGTYYNQTLKTFETSIPITWSIESGSLPDGLSFSDDGRISGTLTTEDTFTFTIKAANSEGFDTQTLRISVTLYDEQEEQEEQEEQNEQNKRQANGGGGCNITSGFILIMLSSLLFGRQNAAPTNPI